MKEQVSRLAKSAVFQYVTVFRFILAKTLISGLRRKGIILLALMQAVTSLWPQKVAFRSQNYSAGAKLMLISDQARDLVKICFEGRRPCVPFKTARLHPGSWINPLCQQSLDVMIYVEKARVIERESNVMIFRSYQVWKDCVWFVVDVLSVPPTWLIVWFPEVVDRQISGMSWRSCYNKHENAL